MVKNKKYLLFYLAIIFFLFSIYVVYLNFQNFNNKFTFAMLDVGQGDALFIQSPTGTQVLIDTGPPNKVIGELNKVMLPFDKSLDLLIISNPDQDHIGGALDILKNYKVQMVLESGTTNSSDTFKEFKAEIKNKEIPNFLARQNMILDLGGDVFLEILFPNQDVSGWERNEGSMVARLYYGQTSILLTGDVTKETEEIILKTNVKEKIESDILKIGHHGSRTSTSYNFLKEVNPKYALISVAQNSKYGHPHKEVLDLLNEFKIEILRTDEIGTIILNCDKMEICKIKKLKN